MCLTFTDSLLFWTVEYHTWKSSPLCNSAGFHFLCMLKCFRKQFQLSLFRQQWKQQATYSGMSSLVKLDWVFDYFTKTEGGTPHWYYIHRLPQIISSISQPGRKYSSKKSSKGGDDLNLGCSSQLCMQRTMSHQNVFVFSVLVVHWGNINLWRKSMWWMYETFSVRNPAVLYARWRKVVEDKLPPYFSPFLKNMFSRSGVVWGCDPVKIGAAAAGCVSPDLTLEIRWQVVKR